MTERVQRLVFGEVADLYDQARPGYPDEVYVHIAAAAGLAPGDQVLEVGAGTGKATAELVARGYAVTAIEPHAAMAAVCERNAPSATVIVADFETWKPTAEFALVACAQAWHWIDPAVGPQKAAASLRPTGWLALWWNRPAPGPDPLHDDIVKVYEQLAPALAKKPGVLTHPIGVAEHEANERLADAGFGPLTVTEFPWSKAYDSASWCALLKTQSDHRLLPPEQLAELLAAVAAVIDAHGTYEFRGETRLVMSQLR